MTPQQVSLTRFLKAAATTGPAVGLATDPDGNPPTPHGYQTRTIDGSRLTTKTQLYDTFAHSWDFPEYFGHNADAFEDCMRDLDHTPETIGFLTVITNAHKLLPQDPGTFTWFAQSIPFYRDHYREFATPPTTFALLLSAPPTSSQTIRTRWQRATVPVTLIHR